MTTVTPEEPIRAQVKAVLINPRRLGAALREMSLEEIGQTLKTLQETYAQKELEQLEELKRLKAKRDKIQAIRQQIEKEGLTIEDIANAPSEVYEYKETDGTKKLWYGKGRMPDRMKALIDSGASLEKMRVV